MISFLTHRSENAFINYALENSLQIICFLWSKYLHWSLQYDRIILFTWDFQVSYKMSLFVLDGKLSMPMLLVQGLQYLHWVCLLLRAFYHLAPQPHLHHPRLHPQDFLPHQGLENKFQHTVLLIKSIVCDQVQQKGNIISLWYLPWFNRYQMRLVVHCV